MSKYTTELRFICEQYAGYNESQPLSKINEIIEKAIPKVFDFNFPIFDEQYRNIICTKIIKHYYTREIGCETVGLWKLWLNTKLNEIMPYYNQLYKSELLKFNPLYDIDMTTSNKGNKNDKSNTKTIENISSNDISDDSRWDLYSDTPQGNLQNVENETYLTNARKATNKSKNIASSNGSSDTGYTNTTTEDYIQKVTGKSSGISYSKLLEEFRKTFLNIDTMIIKELETLFFQLW